MGRIQLRLPLARPQDSSRPRATATHVLALRAGELPDHGGHARRRVGADVLREPDEGAGCADDLGCLVAGLASRAQVELHALLEEEFEGGSWGKWGRGPVVDRRTEEEEEDEEDEGIVEFDGEWGRGEDDEGTKDTCYSVY